MVQMPIAGRELSLHLLNDSDAHLHHIDKQMFVCVLVWLYTMSVTSFLGLKLHEFQIQVEMFALKFLCPIKCKNDLLQYPGIFQILRSIQCYSIKISKGKLLGVILRARIHSIGYEKSALNISNIFLSFLFSFLIFIALFFIRLKCVHALFNS